MSFESFDNHISEISKTDFEFYCEYKLGIKTHQFSSQPLKLYDYQKYIARLLDKKRNLVVVTPRQMGITTLSTAKAFWEVQTKHNIKVVLVVPNPHSIDDITDKIGYWIDNHNYIDSSIHNGGFIHRKFKSPFNCTTTNSEIICISTSAALTKLRGISIDLLILQDFAWMNFETEYMFQNLLSQVKSNGRVFVYSTPSPSYHNQSIELFKNLFIEAKSGKNGFYPYRIPWWARPGHNLELLDNIINTFNVSQWNQEILGEFD